MAKAGKYSVLFEPVKIGPVTARNRFYQVPHCNGMGYNHPRAEAAMRGIKAEGGWGVVSTQEAEIHPTSDLTPYPEARLWDDRDIPGLKLMTDAVHEKGALAAIELAHNGNHAQNLFSRAPVLAPVDMAVDTPLPKQARMMDKADLRALRKWHRDAAIRSKKAGFDIIYVYAGHTMTLTQHFLLPHMNDRGDEYGGGLENRLRLTRELLEDTLEAVGDSCAVAFRFAVDEMQGADGMQAQEEGRAVVELLAELPDLWDVNVSGWANDSATTRFVPQDGFQNDYVSFVKTVTTKPVVAVGRLTSPDMMVSMVRNGIVDLIGAARPSIADPFLPKKIEEGRIDEIRECIGCNICVSADNLGVPIRCTQNPTIGEEWRRGWHPEIIAPKKTEETALVIGAGPAGLECAMQLSRRGYQVTLAEASSQAGGRALKESRLTGLSASRSVVEYRLQDLNQRPNVDLYLESKVDAAMVDELSAANVFVATGTTWRDDGVGRSTQRRRPEIGKGQSVLTPDDIMAGTLPSGKSVVVYDDDQGYIAGVIAEQLARERYDVHFVTPTSVVSAFTLKTLEQHRVQSRLMELGVVIHCNRTLVRAQDGMVTTSCVYTERLGELPCETLVTVTERHRQTALFDELSASARFNSLELIGDAATPGLIADAVWSGHKAARDFERPAQDVEQDWFRRELVSLVD